MTALASGSPGAPADPDDIDRSSFIIYTSGTTGRAKGVLLSVRGMLWIAASCWAPIAELDGEGRRPVAVASFPLLRLESVRAQRACRRRERAHHGKILAAASARSAADRKYTVLPGVPTMFHYLLLRAQESGVERLGAIRLCISAGAIMPATLNRAFEERFKTRLLDGYGITETSHHGHDELAAAVRGRWDRAGCLCPDLPYASSIRSSIEDVPIGEEGELIVRGPNLMQGYHNKPKETAAALRKGWYHTGDLAKSDPNGYLTITGRIKELIIRGGQNIAPAEIEEVVVRHPQVKDCAVVGVKHATLGEVPCLFVVASETNSTFTALLALPQSASVSL